MRYLKQNTDSYITIGPYFDKTAGLGNEDGLTVTSFSGVIVKETHGSAPTHTDFTPSATSSNDWGMAAIGHGGLYQLKVPDSEINFVGSAVIAVWYDAEALPSWNEFMVVPANVWDSMVGTDKLDVNAAELGGTAQTGRDIGASVLLSSGTGTGQLDFTSGVVKSNLVQIMASALSGTAAQIAAAFVKFFDKASPTGTVNSLPDAVPGANGGLPTTNGTKINQTADLTAGQIPTAAENADAVWDEALSGHTGAGTAGNALATASSGGVDPSVLADAIWDEALSGHSTAGTTGKKLTDLTNADLSGVATASQIGTAGAALTAIPWNASWGAEVQSECTDALNAYDPPTKEEVDTACGAVTLKNGAHGGAAATVTLKSVVVSNSEGDAVNFKSTAANKMALKLEGAGTGNSHALYLNSTNGSALAGASGSHGVSITSSAGNGMVIAGATGDIVADITGDLSGAVGSVTSAVTINSNADITAILQDTGTTLDGKINAIDTVVDLIEDIVRNKMEVVEATGAATLYKDDSTTPLLTNTVTSAAGTTTRTRLA